MSKIVQIIPTVEKMYSVKQVLQNGEFTNEYCVDIVHYLALLDSGRVKGLYNWSGGFQCNYEHNEELMNSNEYEDWKKDFLEDGNVVHERF